MEKIKYLFHLNYQSKSILTYYINLHQTISELKAFHRYQHEANNKINIMHIPNLLYHNDKKGRFCTWTTSILF